MTRGTANRTANKIPALNTGHAQSRQERLQQGIGVHDDIGLTWTRFRPSALLERVCNEQTVGKAALCIPLRGPFSTSLAGLSPLREVIAVLSRWLCRSRCVIDTFSIAWLDEAQGR